jgi:hypothetical protein
MQEESVEVTTPTAVNTSVDQAAGHPLGMKFACLLLLCFLAGFTAFTVYVIRLIADEPYVFTAVNVSVTETPVPLTAQHRYA